MQAITIDVIAIIAVGIALAGLIIRMTARIDRYMSEAGADRRALQSAMDAFRTEMQRIAERQAHTEDRLDERTTTGAD